MAGSQLTSHLEQLTVLDLAHVAVVSFIWNLDASATNVHARKIFIVDTWQEIDGNWKVVARYATVTDNSDLPIPGYVAHEHAPHKKI